MGGDCKTPGERDGGVNWTVIHGEGPRWADSCCILDVQLIVPAEGFDSRNVEKRGSNP